MCNTWGWCLERNTRKGSWSESHTYSFLNRVTHIQVLDQINTCIGSWLELSGPNFIQVTTCRKQFEFGNLSSTLESKKRQRCFGRRTATRAKSQAPLILGSSKSVFSFSRSILPITKAPPSPNKGALPPQVTAGPCLRGRTADFSSLEWFNKKQVFRDQEYNLRCCVSSVLYGFPHFH